MSKPETVFTDFGKASLSLAEFLEHDPKLDMVEQIFIENHMHVIGLAFGAWKRRNLSKQREG